MPPHIAHPQTWLDVAVGALALANYVWSAVLHHRQVRLRRRLRAERRLIRHVLPSTERPPAP